MRRSRMFLVSLLTLTVVSATAGCSSDPGQGGDEPGADGGRIDGGSKDADMPIDGVTDSGVSPDGITDTDDGNKRDTLPTDGGSDTSPSDAPTPDTSPDTRPDSTPQDTRVDSAVPQDVPSMPDSGTPPDTSMQADTSVGTDALPMNHGAGSVISSLTIDQMCCRDFTGDGTTDNAIAGLVSQYADLMATNMQINQSIQNGSLVMLFEYKKWSNLAMDSMIEMIAHPGQDATPMNSMDDFSGNGQYLIDPSSYNRMTGKPRAKFSSAQVMSTRKLQAQGNNLPLSVPLTGSQPMNIELKDVHVNATATAGSTVAAGGTVGLTSGQLSGALTKEDLFGGLNQALKNSCSCLNNMDAFADPNNDDVWSCTAAVNSCSGGGMGIAQLCDNFICQAGATLINNRADIDLDTSTSANDAYSFGATFQAKGAKINGIAP